MARDEIVLIDLCFELHDCFFSFMSGGLKRKFIRTLGIHIFCMTVNQEMSVNSPDSNIHHKLTSYLCSLN